MFISLIGFILALIAGIFSFILGKEIEDEYFAVAIFVILVILILWCILGILSLLSKIFPKSKLLKKIKDRYREIIEWVSSNIYF